MRKNIFRIFILLLVVLTTLSLMSAAPVESGNQNESVEWTISADGNTISGGGKTYTYYEIPYMSQIVSKKQFMYTNGVSHPYSSYESDIFSYDKEGEIIWLDGDVFYLYVTEDGRRQLDSFYSGEDKAYILEQYGYEATIDNNFIERLSSYDGERVSFSLPSLSKYDPYQINTCDTKGIVAYPVGTVFPIGGELYYVDHEKLDNSYFGAYGELSYREGRIELVKLEGDILSDMNSYIDKMEYVNIEYVYENDYSNTIYTILGIIGFAWSGILLPICGIVVGCVLPNIKRLGRPKRWYAVAALSGITLVLTILLILVPLVEMIFKINL